MINDLMTKIFGTNWRTAFWGLVSAICSFLLFYDQALDPLPDYWENLTRALVAFLGSAGTFKMGLASRDHVVSDKNTDKINKKIENVKRDYEKF